VEEAADLRQAGRYRESLAAADAIRAPALRQRERLETLWAAGDLGGALGAVRDGLEAEAGGEVRLWLLWRGTALALQLGLADQAAELVGSLEGAIDAAQLPDSERGAWREGAAGLRERSDDLSARLARGEAALVRARIVTLAVGLLALLALARLAR